MGRDVLRRSQNAAPTMYNEPNKTRTASQQPKRVKRLGTTMGKAHAPRLPTMFMVALTVGT